MTGRRAEPTTAAAPADAPGKSPSPALRFPTGPATAALALGSLCYLWTTEGTVESFALAAAACLALAGAVALLTRRTLPAAIATAGLLALFHLASRFKSAETAMLLHAYDVVDALRSPAALVDLVTAHPGYASALAAAVLLLALAIRLARRLDRAPILRGPAAGLLVAAAAASCAAAVAKDPRPHTLYYFWNIHLSAFVTSWPDAIGALVRGKLIEAARFSNGRPFREAAACNPVGQRPHIILIHQESVVPPSLFAALSYDRGLDELFRSHDGKLRTLRVETYGGASWLSEFAVMAGLSTQSFGGMRQLVQPVMAGKLRDALPQVLSRCGYRGVLYYPMLRAYLNSARFFSAMGFEEIVDAKDQGAASASERDRFYYANAIRGLEKHIAASREPMLAYIQTSAAHWPYTYTYEPDTVVPGGGPGTHPEMHEYLRRLAMARMDYAALKSDLARRFPAEQFLIVHYGDHQPLATRTLLGFGEATDIEEVLRSARPQAFLSYYAIDAVNFQPHLPPDGDALDIAYLGTVLLEAAGLPLSESYQERRRLMAVCQGRYFLCSRRDEILTFHRRLIDSRLLDAL